MSEGGGGRRQSARAVMIGIAVAAVVVLAAVGTLVPAGGDRAVIAVARFGDAVRLLPAGLSVSPWPLARRVTVPRRAGDALLEARVSLSLASGAMVPARVSLALASEGRLPVTAAAVREVGWEGAWSAWLESRLRGRDGLAAEALRRSEAWRAIFADGPGPAVVDVSETVRVGFRGAGLRFATLEATPDEALVRSLAREELRRTAPAAGRLVVLGLDALDWRLVDELVSSGVMPNLGRLLARSLQLTVRMRPPLLSPLIWTSIATGQPPEVHGVLDFVEADPGGGTPKPISSASRRVPALWEMASAAGRTAAVIGWWATFPAAAPPGVTIYSDRLSEQLMGLEEDLPGVADPPQAAALARRLAVRGSEVTAAMLAPILEVSESELAAVPAGPEGWDDPIGGAARLIAATLTVQRLTDHELERGTEVVLAYLEGTDTVGHLFAPYRPPAMRGVDGRLARRFGGVVDRYHALVDRWIGRVVGALGPADTLVILSDHGFTWGSDRPRVASGAHTPTAAYWHRPDAVLIVAGPGVPPSRERRRIGVLDVLPCLLAVAGLPAGADLPGTAPAWLLDRRGGVPAKVAYAKLVAPARAATVELPAAAREEELAKLRALGYLAGDGPTAGGAAVPAAAPTPVRTAIPGRIEARLLHNLGLRLADGGDAAAAVSNLRRAIAADPSYPPPHYALARMLRLGGEYDEADAELWTAIDLGVGDPEGALLRVAGEYRRLGRPERAAGVLARATERYPANGTIWLDLGTLAGEQGDIVLAVQCLTRAAELLPDDPLVYRNLAAALIASGDREGARRELTRALELDPTNEQVRRQLASLSSAP